MPCKTDTKLTFPFGAEWDSMHKDADEKLEGNKVMSVHSAQAVVPILRAAAPEFSNFDALICRPNGSRQHKSWQAILLRLWCYPREHIQVVHTQTTWLKATRVSSVCPAQSVVQPCQAALDLSNFADLYNDSSNFVDSCQGSLKSVDSCHNFSNFVDPCNSFCNFVDSPDSSKTKKDKNPWVQALGGLQYS